MRVLHVTPTHFADASVVGGAERFAWELARAMAADAEVTFLALSDRADAHTRDGVRVVHVPGRRLIDHPLARNPISRALVSAIRGADVVHCHQAHTFLTSACLVLGRLLGRPVFVTDLGGGHVYAPDQYLPLLRAANALLLISDYSRRQWEQVPARQRPDRLVTVYAGVDVDRFSPGPAQAAARAEALFVGRILPHKGIEHLIDAIEPPLSVRLVGRIYDPAYADMLRARGAGKAMTFESNLDDDALVERYRGALAVVVPSVATDWRGNTTNVSELFGLVAAEGMACGRPAVVSRTGALPEVVEDGVSGYVVPAADSAALRDRLLRIARDPGAADAMGRRARARVIERFTWPATARRCLDAYRTAL